MFIIFAEIIGFYRLENDLVNGRVWYTHDERYSCWWQIESWTIGHTAKKGSDDCLAYLDRDIPCLHDVNNQWDWKIGSMELNDFVDAGKSIEISNGPNTGK